MQAEPSDFQAIDASMKALLRTCPAALLQLAGVKASADTVRIEDANINVPEQRADHVFILPAQSDTESERAIYCEYQLTPDRRILSTWFSKCGALTKQLDIPVVLLAVYLQQGDRKTFPDRYIAIVDGLRIEFVFPTLRLWEAADRIRSGEFAALAPLLVLCEDEPSRETVLEEIALIKSAALSEQVRTDLMAVALRVASSRLSWDILEPLFRKELEIMKEQGVIAEWLSEREREGEARGEARGEVKGEVRGERNIIIRQGTRRFGPPSSDVLERLSAIDSLEFLEALSLRLLEVESWTELIVGD